MIGRSNHFADIVCPFDERGCARPYCHFWHSKDEATNRVALPATTVAAAPPESSFSGYVGYVGNDAVSQIPAAVPSESAIYQPENGYFGSIASTSNVPQPSETVYKGSVESTTRERPRRRPRSPVESLTKPKLPVELPVEDILDPNMDKVSEDEKSVQKTEQVVPQVKEKKLHDYVKSVAVIDTRIEELQKAIEKERREKEKMIFEFKSKTRNGVEYVPSKKNSVKEEKKVSVYSGGYTPTPIALLKSKAEKVNKVQRGSVEGDAEVPSTSKGLKAKEPLEKRISIEDLFDDGPPAKKQKTKSSEKRESEKTAKQQNAELLKSAAQVNKLKQSEKTEAKLAKITEAKKQEARNGTAGASLTADQIKAAKKRVAVASNSQAYFQRLNTPPVKKHAPNVAQQLVYRYEKLQKEKEEIMKKVKEKSAQAEGKRTLEDEFGSKPSCSGTLAKGEKRLAHAANLTKASATKVMPLDPCSTSKVPYTLRMRYIELFHVEFLKISDSASEAVLQAQQEEKALKDKAVTKGGYTSAAVNTLRRLREATKGIATTAGEPKSVSHAAVLAGRHHGSITVGKRKHAVTGTPIASESEFYDALNEKYVLSTEQLEKNGYPLWKTEEKTEVKIVASERDAKKKLFVAENDLKRICCRCGAEFRLTPNHEYASMDQCVYHWGRAYKTRTQGAWESRYSCCSSDLTVKGCCVADFHVTDTCRVSELEKFIETPPPDGPSDARSRRIYAVDCEMVYTTGGLSLARISAVDAKDDLVLDVLVRPQHPIVDCNTRFSGLTKDQLEKAEYSFEEAQQRFFQLVNNETILIGHSFESDLKAMKLVHHKVVDTSVVYPHRLGPPFKRALKTITSEVLQLIIQEDVTGHDSKEDSSACMRLMLHKVKHG